MLNLTTFSIRIRRDFCKTLRKTDLISVLEKSSLYASVALFSE